MSRVRVPDGVPEFRQRKLMKIERRTWPVGQVVKTEASHAFNIGSNPVRVTTFSLDSSVTMEYNMFVSAEALANSWC